MTENDLITFAGLLHDIGKFTYRSIDPEKEKRNDHETLGCAFIDNYFSNVMYFKENPGYIIRLKDYSKRGNASVHGADCLSANERITEATGNLKALRPLESVLSKVNLNNRLKNNKFKYFLPYNDKTEQYVPQEFSVENIDNWKLTKEQEKDLIIQNAASYEQFLDEVKLLRPIRDFRSFYTSFYYIFERYGSRICSAGYASRPDISLFDHSRNVAALALCRKLRQDNLNDDCILLTADFSGIQKFIYDDVFDTENVAKTLRGRSFFVKLFSDAVVSYILKELNLYESNILMNSGGHFILIIPKTKENNYKITMVEQKINTMLFNRFTCKIQMIFATITCKSEELHKQFKEENTSKYYFRDLLKNLNNKLNKNKKQANYSIIEDIVGKSYSPKTNKDNVFKRIGELLPDSDYLIEIQSENFEIGKLKEKDLFAIFSDFGESDLGFYYVLVKGTKLKDTLEKLDDFEIDRIIVYSLDREENNKYVKNYSHLLDKSRHNIALGFKYDGSFIPKNSYGAPATFEDLAKPIDSSKDTYSMLGALRMDVDNLGRIFIEGLDDKDYSISKYASLSREINNFFMDKVPAIAEEHHIYLVYAGGDDLFAVGNWQEIIDFARAVKGKLDEFSSNNPDITISGGIVTVKPGFPISRFSQSAGEEEEKAKDINTYYEKIFNKAFADGDTKNAISLFGRQVKWDTFDNMMKIKNMLQDIIEPSRELNMPLSFIHFLLQQTQLVFDRNGKFQIDKVHRTVSKMHYMFARSGINSKKIEEYDNHCIDNAIEKYKIGLAKCFMGKDKHQDPNVLTHWYHNFRIPATYIIYKNREKK